MTKAISPAAQLYTLVEGNYKAPHRSRERYSHTMDEAIELAIHAGLRFDADDFTVHGSLPGPSEFWYFEAIAYGNTSACIAIEKAKNRPAFIMGGQRLYVGAKVRWQGLECVVTSFGGNDEPYMVLGHYEAIHRSQRVLPRSLIYRHYGEGRPSRLFKVTRNDLKDNERRRREAGTKAVEQEAPCSPQP